MQGKDKKIPISEVFGPTIQGEGFVAGQRTVFIRFGLCDYKCKMCDSMHAVDPVQVKAHARWMTQQEIAQEVLERLIETNCTSVTFSGGNPCIHDLSFLVDILNKAEVKISLETQGTLWHKWVYNCDYVTVSPKGPGMGEKFEKEVFEEFVTNTEPYVDFCVKVVIFDVRDLEFASMIMEILAPISSRLEDLHFYLSLGNPVLPDEPPDRNKMPYTISEHRAVLSGRFDQILEEMKSYPVLNKARFLPQVHVLLYGNEKGR